MQSLKKQEEMIQVMKYAFKALKPQRPEGSERAKQDIECCACHEKVHFSQNCPNKKEHLNEDRPGREKNPPGTAPASNVFPVLPKTNRSLESNFRGRKQRHIYTSGSLYRWSWATSCSGHWQWGRPSVQGDSRTVPGATIEVWRDSVPCGGQADPTPG